MFRPSRADTYPPGQRKIGGTSARRLTVFTGADHMGPFTHRTDVNALILSHLTGVQSRLQQA
jgi:hypothetical protein